MFGACHQLSIHILYCLKFLFSFPPVHLPESQRWNYDVHVTSWNHGSHWWANSPALLFFVPMLAYADTNDFVLFVRCDVSCSCWLLDVCFSVSILNSNRRELNWMKVLWDAFGDEVCCKLLGADESIFSFRYYSDIIHILCMNWIELNWMNTAALHVLFPVYRASNLCCNWLQHCFPIWQILGEREGIGILQSTLGAWADLGRSGQRMQHFFHFFIRILWISLDTSG